MISAETVAELEARRLLYILGVRERSDKLVRELVLEDAAPFVPLAINSRLWTGSGRLVLGNTLSALPRMTLTLVCVILADLTDQDLERGDSTDDAALGAGLRAAKARSC
jgi:hypothetical protein